MEFALNGEGYRVDPADAAGVTLNEFIRTKTRFKGTKLSCAQGGCGACTVAVTTQNSAGEPQTKTVPSCLVPLVSVAGSAVTTVEGLKKAACPSGGYGAHPVQERLVAMHGTQCGFCTPGMVMQMWGGLTQARAQGGSALTERQIEDMDILAGNLCRCTGYRPIQDTLKSFAKDTTVQDNVAGSPVGSYDAKRCDPKFPKFLAQSGGQGDESKQWSRPRTLQEAMKIWASGDDISIVSGHTAWGVYPDLCRLRGVPTARPESRVLQVDRVAEMKAIRTTGGRVEIGAAATLAELADALSSTEGPAAAAIRDHVLLIAGHQVRNVASVGGNLMMVREKGFASDLATLVAAAEGQVTYVDKKGAKRTDPVAKFLQSAGDAKGPVMMVSVSVRVTGQFLSYRAALRPRNAYSLINAGLAYDLGSDGKITRARVVFGAVSRFPVEAEKLSKALVGLRASTAIDAIDKLMPLLEDVYQVFTDDEHKQYRTRVAQAFLLRFAQAMGGSVDAVALHARGTRQTHTKQSFAEVDREQKAMAPLFQPHAKTTARAQATGGARFTDDAPKPKMLLHAAYVTIPDAAATFVKLDTKAAEAALGSDLVKVISASDLDAKERKIRWKDYRKFPTPPGHDTTDEWEAEWVFLPAGVPSQYGSQPVAVVLATSQRLAESAAALIRLDGYAKPGSGSGSGRVVTTEPEDAPIAPGTTPYQFSRGDVKKTTARFEAAEKAAEKDSDAKSAVRLVRGSFNKRAQANFYIEPQTCMVEPDEEKGLIVNIAAQGVDYPRKVIASQLGVKESGVQINMRRLGGGFGGKISRSIPSALVASIAAVRTGRPVRFVLPREVDMAMNAGRQTLVGDWKALADVKTGRVLAVQFDLLMGQGSHNDYGDLHTMMIGQCVDMVYNLDSVVLNLTVKQTHDGPSTAVRAPGHLEAVMLIESVMDGVAGRLDLPAELVRETNFYPTDRLLGTQGLKGGMLPPAFCEKMTLIPVWNKLIRDSKYTERKRRVAEFNATNRWRKRGIAVTPAKYGMFRVGGHGARVDVLSDGSLQISTNGVEMGQGLHTKLGQTALAVLRSRLGVTASLDLVRFTNQNSHVFPNGSGTGGSTTSEQCAFAVEDAARKIADRMKPFIKSAQKMAKKKGKPAFDWVDLVRAGMKGTTPFWTANFSAQGWYRPELKDFSYDTYGCCVSEVEIDVLTGESKTLYSHLMFDLGASMNPAIDMGQIEGAYVMGLGQMLLEERKHTSTGALASTNTWSYKPPTAYDIPETFIVDCVDMRKQENTSAWPAVLGTLGSALSTFGMFHKPTKGKQIMRSSKATGEPPVLFSYSIMSALRNAVIATGRSADPALMTLSFPATPEVVSRACWGEAKNIKELQSKGESKTKIDGDRVRAPESWQPGNKSAPSAIPRLMLNVAALTAAASCAYMGAKKKGWI